MTDRPDPRDPLQGLDPYPRERIDGLHAERADLLEEIVSTPGPGKQPMSARKVLLPIGIAAALAIVGGGVWFATGDDDAATDDAPVAAASSTAPDPTEPDDAATTDETGETEPSETASPSDDVRVGGVQVGKVDELDTARRGDVLAPEVCRSLRGAWRVGGEGRPRELVYIGVPDGKGKAGRLPMVLRRSPTRLDELRLYFADGPHGRWLAIDRECTVVDVGKGDAAVRLKPRTGRR